MLLLAFDPSVSASNAPRVWGGAPGVRNRGKLGLSAAIHVALNSELRLHL